MVSKIPKTREEVFNQLDSMLNKSEREVFVKADPIVYHFSLGLWIRNNWIYEQDEEDVKRLAKVFRLDPHFFEADDLSSKILESYKRHLKKLSKNY